MVKNKNSNTGEPLVSPEDKPAAKEAAEVYEEPGLPEETEDILPLPEGMEALLNGKAAEADDFLPVSEETDADEGPVYEDFSIDGERKPQEPTPEYILSHDKTAADALLEEDFGAAEVPDISLEAEEGAEEDISAYAPPEDGEDEAEAVGFAALFSRRKRHKAAKNAVPVPDRTITEELAFVTDSLPKNKAAGPAKAPEAAPAAAAPEEAAARTVPEKQKSETAAMAAPEPDPMKKRMISMVASLTIICGVIALLLAAVNAVTKDVIAENVTKRQSEAILRVFPEGTDVAQYVSNENVYIVYREGSVIGYCASVEPMGYKDGISMMVGVDLDGVVSGIQIVEMSETSGVGTKVKAESFLGQFFGAAGPFAVGDNVDGIVGATVSSKAVTEGVNAALEMLADVDPRQIPVKHETETETESVPVIETEPVAVETEPGRETETDPPETETENQVPETETRAPETIPPETIPPETTPPETQAPETIPPETQAPETTPPETQAPETTPPETQAPETTPPETQAPETTPPETQAPETTPPETQAPETAPPETQAPETAPPETETTETGAVTEKEAVPPETESESAETEAETGSETDTAAPETEPADETGMEADTEAEITAPETEPETAETVPEDASASETESEAAPETESVLEAETESAADTESSADTEDGEQTDGSV